MQSPETSTSAALSKPTGSNKRKMQSPEKPAAKARSGPHRPGKKRKRSRGRQPPSADADVEVGWEDAMADIWDDDAPDASLLDPTFSHFSASTPSSPTFTHLSASTPSSTLPPACPAREAALLGSVRELGALFSEVCADALGKKKAYAHFEPWLWTLRAETGDRDGVVQVLPRCVAGDRDHLSVAGSLLAAKLIAAGQPESVRTSCKALEDRAAQLADAVERGATARGGAAQHGDQRASDARPCPSTHGVSAERVGPSAAAGTAGKARQGNRGQTEGGAGPSSAELVRLSCGGVSADVSVAHLRKLWALYRRHHSAPPAAPAASTAQRAAFVAAAFCALARLLALQGGDERAGGMQAAVPAAACDALRMDFGASAEAFGSPLNTRYGTFCSAAADVDSAFGSRGSFFTLAADEARAYLANPPFDSETVVRMVRHMESLLTTSARLSFVVVVPRTPAQEGWRALMDCAYRRADLTLPRSKHAFVDGGQQYGRRETALRLSNHDTSVIFLQSAAAAADPASRLTPDKEARLRQGFTGGFQILGAIGGTGSAKKRPAKKKGGRE